MAGWIVCAVLYGFAMKKKGSEHACVTVSGSGEDEVISMASNGPMLPCSLPCPSSQLAVGPPRGWAVLDPSLHHAQSSLGHMRGRLS